ncbi:MAG: hypothetical protein HY913_18990 [Desulfomonile tiedjei]|nr:hypothetical protein [Desulfomonile tiedjei]
MKGLITVLAILCLLITTQVASARGGANYRSAIDRKWKEVQAENKRRDQHFKKIEQEAKRSLRGIPGQDGPAESIPYPGCRTCP